MTTFFVLLFLLTTFILLILLLTATINAFAFPRLQTASHNKSALQPHVSILIPARNEATRIGPTLQALCQQTYANYKITVLDDHSEDDTAAIIQQLMTSDVNLSMLSGQPLPEGWLGKNWACHQLAQYALASEIPPDLLLFIDADVHWEPDALAAIIDLQQHTDADLLTVWPTQITYTRGERLVVPLMALAIHAYLPVWLAHYTPFPQAAAANGQCMLFARNAYVASGGHAAVRDQIVEDVRLAQRIKAVGKRLRISEGNGLVLCRMYTSWDEVYAGYAKNILAGHGNSTLFLLFSTIFHLTIFVLPWLLIITSILWLIPCLLGVGVRALTAAISMQRLRDAWGMPVSALLMTRIGLQSLLWHWRDGGPQWKGRVLK
ncbi:MAG: glycosyltransferase [Chloroflexota bacterium]